VKEHNPRKTKHKLVRVEAIVDAKLLVKDVKSNIAIHRQYLWNFCISPFSSGNEIIPGMIMTVVMTEKP
jgi:hypothetical protein